MQVFSTTLPDRLERLRLVISASDYCSIEQEAHFIKGSSASLGMSSIAALADALEQNACQQTLASAHDLLQKIERDLEQIYCLISRL